MNIAVRRPMGQRIPMGDSNPSVSLPHALCGSFVPSLPSWPLHCTLGRGQAGLSTLSMYARASQGVQTLSKKEGWQIPSLFYKKYLSQQYRRTVYRRRLGGHVRARTRPAHANAVAGKDALSHPAAGTTGFGTSVNRAVVILKNTISGRAAAPVSGPFCPS